MISVSTLLIFGESKHALGDYVGCGYGLDIIGFWRTENQRITCRRVIKLHKERCDVVGDDAWEVEEDEDHVGEGCWRGDLFQRPSQPRAS